MPCRSTHAMVPTLALIALGTLALGACGDGTSDPATDPLAGLDELALYAATADRLSLLQATEEPHQNLRQAVGWPRGSYEGLFGTARVFETGVGWVADEEALIGPDEIRVAWYRFTGDAMAMPPTVRGHASLLRLTHPTLTAVRVNLVHESAGVVGDYALRVGTTATAQTSTDHLWASGLLGNGSRNLEFTLNQEEILGLASWDQMLTLMLAEGAFAYNATVIADSTMATGATSVDFTATVTLDGVASRVDIELDVDAAGTMTGTGSITHAGTRIANLAAAGPDLQITFTRPDGGTFSAAQQLRLRTLIDTVLMPVASLQTYFS
jgi:hypothetical protein